MYEDSHLEMAFEDAVSGGIDLADRDDEVLDEELDLEEEARAWLLDCGADPDDVENAEFRALVLEVNKHFEGGWLAFCYTFDF